MNEARIFHEFMKEKEEKDICMKFNETPDKYLSGEMKTYSDDDCMLALWKLLDDIDTASDKFKPNDLKTYKDFYEYVMNKVEERHKYMKSTGHTLYKNDL